MNPINPTSPTNPTTKSALLALLQARQGGMLSGEEAAAALNVSRAAVWKAVQALRGQGLNIDATPGGGYRLAGAADVLSVETLQAALSSQATPVTTRPLTAKPFAPPLRVLDETDSTNLVAKRWAIEGAPHGSLVVATRQSAGRGRLGRGFASPSGGLYLSVVLRPRPGLFSAGLVTASVAVAVCRAVSQRCGLQLGIKWVNDLYLNGKKCCGILTEAASGAETGEIEYLVAGIGINYLTPASAFPPEVAGMATSLYPDGGAPASRAALAAAIRAELLALFDTLPSAGFLEEYRARSVVLSRAVTVQARPPYTARAVAIDDEARLIVEKPDGARVALGYGEISIRL